MKKHYFQKQTKKEYWEKVLTSLMSGLIEAMGILLSAFAFSLLLYDVLVEVYEENPTSCKYVVRNGKSILRFLR